MTGKGYFIANVVTSINYSSARGNLPEPTGDVLGGNLPAVDITYWSLDVATP